LYKIILIF